VRERLLVRHFLRRFLDNDLISPNADRHVAIVTAVAALIAPALFVTVLLSFKYQYTFNPPGVTALSALDDRFLYFGCSMVIMAVVAVGTWDALSLDARDTAILGTLPVSRWAVVRAKSVAVVVFASAFAAAVNLLPSLMYPALLPGKVLPVGVTGLVTLIAAHALVSALSGAFGFLAVLACRETLRAALGTWWSRQVSTLVRGGLLVFLAAVFLLLPVLASDVGRTWLGPGQGALALPPLWFVGVHETVAGHVLDRLPREALLPRPRARDTEATALYRSYGHVFRRLAGTGLGVLVFLVAITAAAYAWNSRRPPDTRVPRHGRGQGLIARAAAALLLVRHPLSRAGFFFALQTLSRSASHQLTTMTSIAAGLAAAAFSLRGVDLRQVPIPLAIFVPQTVLVMTCAIGFRQAVRVPADPRVSWLFALTWSGDERPYISGVKRAGLARLTVPLLLALLPIHALWLGRSLALAHLACGLLLGFLLVELLFLDSRRLPFVSSLTPAENLWGWMVIYLLTFLASVYAVAWLEQSTFSAGGALTLVGWLLAAVIVVHGLDMWLRRRREPINLDDLPAPPTQRFELRG